MNSVFVSMVLAIIFAISTVIFALFKAQPNQLFTQLFQTKRYRNSKKFLKLADEIMADALEALGPDNRSEARVHLPLVDAACQRGKLMMRRKAFSILIKKQLIESKIQNLESTANKLKSLPKFSNYEDFMKEAA
jgi:hypothetical protein